MSRIGKKPIQVPSGVTVSIEKNTVVVAGPNGQNKTVVPSQLNVAIDGEKLIITPKYEGQNAVYGTTRTLLQNSILGATQNFEKQLEIKGVGFRAKLEGKTLVLQVGYSHQVRFDPPESVSFAVKGTTISVIGKDKQEVGEIAAQVRAIRPPDAYKGKGIRYKGEVVRLKPGKAVKTAGAA
jgi:large subunit ribosomal protein L6